MEQRRLRRLQRGVRLVTARPRRGPGAAAGGESLYGAAGRQRHQGRIPLGLAAGLCAGGPRERGGELGQPERADLRERKLRMLRGLLWRVDDERVLSRLGLARRHGANVANAKASGNLFDAPVFVKTLEEALLALV